MQSGKPVGIFRTHAGAPRVLIANSLLVPAWATWENFRDLEHRGLTMFGQMTAGSWIYIGTQGIVQGTYETFAAVARRHFGGTLSGRLVVTAGLGGMGGAQPLAAVLNGAAALIVEVDPAAHRAPARDALPGRIGRQPRRRPGACRAVPARAGRRVRSGSAPTLPTSCRRSWRAAWRPTSLTDQTSAHDTLNGYVPNGLSLDEAARLRERSPGEYVDARCRRSATHVAAMLDSRRGAP